MRRSIPLIFALSLIALRSAFPQDSLDKWEVADQNIKRLPPSSFPGLPPTIVKALEAGGYTIPQRFGNSKPHNVIHGQFKRRGQIDWAVLASKDRISSVIIFWRGSANDTSHVLTEGDGSYLQALTEGIVFSRDISVATRKQILEYNHLPDDSSTAWINHDGIEDYFVEKASSIYYFHEGHWIDFSGAD